MSILDWVVLIGTQISIVAYGIWKSRGAKDIRGYLLSDKDMSWFTIGLSIMATQASAITFLSTPGQAFGDGMRFIHFYLGVPIAMVVISIVAVPIYHKLNVYTAYEYLETRFGVGMRLLTAFLFLAQRSFAAGISIYAPAIILSKVLGWDLNMLSVIIGFIVITYTVTGGTKAVSHTQKQQMFIITLGMIVAGYMLVKLLPESMGLGEAVTVAGKMGRLNVIDFDFDLSSKYNIWTGLLGGTFLALSYFGTDQSQVQRYLGGRSVAESRLGLLMNGILKVPMQFLILFVGVLLFVFYQFNQPPIYFNSAERDQVTSTVNIERLQTLEDDYASNFSLKKEKTMALVQADEAGNSTEVQNLQTELKGLETSSKELKKEAISIIHSDDLAELTDEAAKEKQLDNYIKKDRDFVFISFVIEYLPEGLIGLLIAVILSAAMSSASSELNSLATTSVVDFYKRVFKKEGSDSHYLKASKWLTLFWGLSAIAFTQLADKLENLIQAVNFLGSVVYGVILGIFVVAFFFKKVGEKATFIAAVIAEAVVIYCALFTDIPYLWFNVIGCIPLIILAVVLQQFMGKEKMKIE
ncbi:MAG: SSS family solute:Na+ symporter [Arenicella sp.]|jgi:SSS family solute:Na+ symporter